MNEGPPFSGLFTQDNNSRKSERKLQNTAYIFLQLEEKYGQIPSIFDISNTCSKKSFCVIEKVLCHVCIRASRNLLLASFL